MEQDNKTIEELVREQLEQNKSELIRKSFDMMFETASSSFKWKLESAVQSEIEKIFNEEGIKSAVQEVALTTKEKIVANMAQGLEDYLPKIGALFAEAMYLRVVKNLDINTYNGNKIFKELFN